MNYTKQKIRTRIKNIAPGTLFTHNECIALKSEYVSGGGLCLCYIVGSGEVFWGGFNTATDVNNLLVYIIK